MSEGYEIAHIDELDELRRLAPGVDVLAPAPGETIDL
jgi:hypothetical protein